MKFKNFKDLRISLKLGLFLMSVALIAATNYAGVIYFINIQKDDAAVVDAAGRNRMISQRIAFFCERAAKEQPVKDDLKVAIELLNTSINALKLGGVAPGIANDRILPSTPQHILPTLTPVEDIWKDYKANAEIILTNPALIDTTQTRYDSASASLIRVSQKLPNPKVSKSLLFIEQNAGPFLVKLNDLVKMYVQEADTKQSKLKNFLLTLLLLSIAVVVLGIYLTNRYISKPVTLISGASGSLAEGNLHVNVTYDSQDEIGAAAANMKSMATNLEKASDFAAKIGQGIFESSYKPASEHDKLGYALITMRDKLVEVNKEDKKRNWATEGLAKFSELLRNDQDDMRRLSNAIISHLVNYLEANQGGIFIVNDDNSKDVHLEMVAMYAWNKKKFTEKRIEKGEGLAGQAWLEKEIIYMKEVPDNYVEITSGLGHATPRSIMVIPLKLNGEIFGVMELASFKEYEPFEREFVIRLAETIAATISSAKVNERTKRLLEQSQQQAEELRSQEEEMRQNMEEMQATQEEIARKEREYVRRITELEQAVGTSKAQTTN